MSASAGTSPSSFWAVYPMRAAPAVWLEEGPITASYGPALEGVRAGSPSCTSMDVHVGSSPPHSGCLVTAQAFGQGVTLEASVPDDRVSGSADDTELVPAKPLQVAPGGDPLPSHQLISHDLGVPSFFSNLQVFWFLLV